MIKKLTYLIMGLFLYSLSAFAQKQYLGVSYSFSNNTVIRSGGELTGVGSTDGNGALSLGLNFGYALNDQFSFTSGFQYLEQHVTRTPAFYPGISMAPHDFSVYMVSIPLHARMTLWKYLYLEAGPNIEFQANSAPDNYLDDQSGIGVHLGLGGQYQWRQLSISVSPYFAQHALIPFQKENYQQHLTEFGLQFGLGVHF